jgi:Na+/phosphate symporter
VKALYDKILSYGVATREEIGLPLSGDQLASAERRTEAVLIDIQYNIDRIGELMQSAIDLADPPLNRQSALALKYALARLRGTE